MLSQLTNVHKLENMDYDAFSRTAYGDEAAMRIRQYGELFARGNGITRPGIVISLKISYTENKVNNAGIVRNGPGRCLWQGRLQLDCRILVI